MALLARVIAGLQALAGWRRYLLAALLGALLAASHAPLYLWPVALLCLIALQLMLAESGHGWRCFLTAYAFAYAYFVAGLYWIGIAFFVDADRFALLLPLPVLGLPLLMALYPAAGIWLACRLAGDSRVWRFLLFAAGWTLGELLRGFVMTGFPWNLVAYVWADWPAAMQSAAWIGSHGLGVATLLACSGAAIALHPGGRRRVRQAALLLPLGLVAIVAAGALRLPAGPVQTEPGIRLRLVQPSIPQTLRWVDELRQKNLEQHIQLSLRPGETAPTHIIWPETAIPYLLDEAEALRQALARLAPPGGALISGGIRRSLDAAGKLTLYNSLFALDGTGAIAARYDKMHLVPFGEYLPFRGLLAPLGLDKLAVGAVDFSSGSTASALPLPGLPDARVLICYEAIFPDEMVPGDGSRPGLLLNITNDSWFGQSTGPFHHFAASRMRAVEQGLPLVRAANNGISAIVDPYGRVLARLGLNAIGVVDGPLPAALPPTLYARWDDKPVWLFVAAWLLFGWRMARRARSH